MSALTKTAATYSGMFAIFLIFLLPVLGKGDAISDAYGDIGKVLLLLFIISGVLAVVFELLVRKANMNLLREFAMRVSVIRVALQIIALTYLLSMVIQFDKWGVSYLLFIAVMGYTVLAREKRRSEMAFWLVNICCTIVICCTFGVLVLIMAVRGWINTSEGAWMLLKIMLSCATFGIGSYLNYSQSVRSRKK